jgi:hypothetical protein
MTRIEKIGSRLTAAFFAATLLAACASEAVGPVPTIQPQEGHAFLKIVGQKNVFLDTGGSREIVVRYVNDNDEGLAGSVSFRIEGSSAGGSLSQSSQVTGPGGEVRVHVIGGNESAFRVIAEAQYATPVDWAVAVRSGTIDPPLPFNIVGTYRVESQFDLATGLPGKLGEVVNTFIDLTDSPNDPTTFLLDLASKADAGVNNVLKNFRPVMDVALNTLLKQLTTFSIDNQRISVVAKFQEFGNGFGEVSRKFGLKSQIQIYRDPANADRYLAKHTVDGVFFKIKNKRTDRTMAQLNMSNIVVDAIPVTLQDESMITFGEHNIGLNVGKVIVFGANNVLIPLITQNRAMNFTELLTDLIDCYDVADTLSDEIGGSSDLWESICETALTVVGNVLEGKVSELGGTASEFRIGGTVRPSDNNADGKVDELVAGEWEGRLMLGTAASPLSRPNQKFTGTRMGN